MKSLKKLISKIAFVTKKQTKDIYRIIEKHFILLFGTGLFTYSLFNFDNIYHQYNRTRSDGISNLATYYYYNDVGLLQLTIGAILIVIGILKIKDKNEK